MHIILDWKQASVHVRVGQLYNAYIIPSSVKAIHFRILFNLELGLQTL